MKHDIAARLKEERLRLGFSQEKMAGIAGVTRRPYAEWEIGNTSPTAEALASLAKSGIDIQYVVTGIKGSGAVVSLNKKQPRAQVSNGPAIWELVQTDMRERDQMGQRKHGTQLQAHNGRDAMVDAYQEVLDAAVYLRQAIFERDGK